MKVIIDIPEGIYKASQIINVKYEDVIQIPLEVIANGTPIPDNATNGDVIKTMFGDDKLTEFYGCVRIIERVGNWFGDGEVTEFDNDWWNAQYQKGGV